MRPVTHWAGTAVLAWVLLGCGAYTPSLGDPAALPADRVADADRVGGGFRVLPTAPPDHAALQGIVVLARHDDGTTVTLRLDRLPPDTGYIAHVHRGPCRAAGGPRYEFDPARGDGPPNEIHLAFTSTAAGEGFMTAENDRVAGPAARSVVVHLRGRGSVPVACAVLS